MIVFFVGSNPSTKSQTNAAFDTSTQSGQRLQQWMDAVDLSNAMFVNVSDQTTPGNRPLQKNEIRENLHQLHNRLCIADRVIAVGKTAETALNMLSTLDFYAIPHPSGMNRKLNDADYVESMLRDMKLYIWGDVR